MWLVNRKIMGEETEQQQLNQEDIEMAEEIKQETQQAEQSSYTWPVIRFDVSPYRTYNFYNQFRTNPSNPNNFLKGIRWFDFVISLFDILVFLVPIKFLFTNAIFLLY